MSACSQLFIYTQDSKFLTDFKPFASMRYSETNSKQKTGDDMIYLARYQTASVLFSPCLKQSPVIPNPLLCDSHREPRNSLKINLDGFYMCER